MLGCFSNRARLGLECIVPLASEGAMLVQEHPHVVVPLDDLANERLGHHPQALDDRYVHSRDRGDAFRSADRGPGRESRSATTLLIWTDCSVQLTLPGV
jgi:hypothetical protein